MRVEFSEIAKKEFLKLDKPIKIQVQKFILKLQKAENPRELGKPLVGNFKGLWRYRVGNHRLVCDIKDDRFIINILKIGHRKDIYCA